MTARPSAQWRKAPVALSHHPSVLLGVLVAALLASLAASSAPFVTTAAASEALRTRLAELTTFATGVEVSATSQLSGTESPADLDAADAAAGAAGSALRTALGHLRPPVLTTQVQPNSGPPLAIVGPGGTTAGVLMARSGALAHVSVLSSVSGPGIWLSDITAQATGAKAGSEVSLEGLEGVRHPHPPRLRVKGIYRALAHTAETDYWSTLFQVIYPQCLNCGVPPPFVFLSQSQISSLVAGSQPALTRTVDLPISSRGLTLQTARGLVSRIAAQPKALRTSAPGRELGCAGPAPAATCTVTSSLSAAVILADQNASAVTPAVSLLSDLGTGIALAVAAAAGVFLVRRRRGEAALLYARGEHVAVFAARSAVEVLGPMLLGTAAGTGIAYALTAVFAPSGAISGATVADTVVHAAVVLALGLALLVAGAATSFLRLYDTGSRGLGRLGVVPWEALLAAGAVYLLLRIRSGGGITTSASGAHAPTLAVFVYPLLLVAAVAGVAARAARVLLRRSSGVAARSPAPVYLALRRLAAARGLVVVLAVVAAISLGSLFYVETLAGSLDQTTIEKAYMATGSDASALVPGASVLPPQFPYPITLVGFANQSASLPDGDPVDVMVVDPTSLQRTLHWQGDWGPSPARFLAALARAPARPLPMIVTNGLAGVRKLVIAGTEVTVRPLAVVNAFPFMVEGIPLAVVSNQALAAFEARTKLYDSLGVLSTYVWGKGPPTLVGRALDSLDPAYPPQTTEAFLHDPEVVLATRTFRYMRLIAIASGVLALVGLALYLQARQRSQAITAALTRRMGLGPLAQFASLTLELAALLAFACIVGAAVAVTAALPIVHRIDPLPVDPPAPIFVVPSLELAIAVPALLAVAALAGAAASLAAARTDVNEALRVA